LHAKIFAALRTSIQDAIRIGELLTEAKQKAGHEGFANEESNDLATSKEE
jgi:hypothetical protein